MLTIEERIALYKQLMGQLFEEMKKCNNPTEQHFNIIQYIDCFNQIEKLSIKIAKKEIL